MNKIKNKFKESYIVNSVGNSLLEDDCSKSYFGSWINAIILGFFKFFDFIYKKLKNFWDNSFFISYIQNSKYILPYSFGFIYCVCSIIPDARWKNLYLVLSLMLLFFIFAVKIPKIKEIRGIKDIDSSFLVYQFVFLVATIISINKRISLTYLIGVITIFIFVILLVNFLEDEKSLAILSKVIAITCILESFYCIYQLKFTGIVANPSYTDFSISQGLGARVTGTFGNPNILGEFLLLSSPFILANFFNSKNKGKIIWIIFSLPVLYALLKTGSRSAWVSFMALVTVFLLLKDIRYIIPLIIISIIGLFLMPNSIYIRFISIFNKNDRSISSRKKIYAYTKLMIKNHPYGIGLGSKLYHSLISGYVPKNFFVPSHSHNLFLQIWVEQGFLGLLIYIFFLIRIGLKTIYINYKTSKNSYVKDIMLASFTSIFGAMVMGLADNIFFYYRIHFALWINIAILFVCYRFLKEEIN